MVFNFIQKLPIQTMANIFLKRFFNLSWRLLFKKKWWNIPSQKNRLITYKKEIKKDKILYIYLEE